MRVHKSMRLHKLSAALVLGGCGVADVEVEPLEDLVVAGVTVVATVDPLDPSRAETRATALVTRFHRQKEHELPGAAVRIVGESGRVLRLAEAPDPLATCVTPLPEGEGATRPPAGSCHVAFEREAVFLPGERLTLTVALPDGGALTAESRMPGLFAPDAPLEDGRCRVDPDSAHRFDWTRAEGSWGYIAEARFDGLWTDGGSLRVEVVLRGADNTGVAFPRGFAGLDMTYRQYRALQGGLPEGAGAEVAVGAVDRNWANWTRPGQLDGPGHANIPSVFGDGTGWFGAAVRWKASVEARAAAGEDDLPLCGPALDD